MTITPETARAIRKLYNSYKSYCALLKFEQDPADCNLAFQDTLDSLEAMKKVLAPGYDKLIDVATDVSVYAPIESISRQGLLDWQMDEKATFDGLISKMNKVLLSIK